MTENTVEKKPIQCPICGAEGPWVNVDEYRLKPEGMCICANCGFCTYPEIVEKSEELKEYYRKEYRPGPSVANLFTGQRKLHKHANFLNELMDSWSKKGKAYAPEIFEVGAAFGMFLDYFKKSFPNAKVSGSELTLSFRRVCYWEYGIELAEEFDDSKQYDLITSYKVLEHMAHPDRELRRYALALKENGRLYISVPTWFHTMANFGMDGFTLDYYYDKNHVNVWTRKLFETLLKKCGLEIIKSNYVYYDSTYLCRRNDALMGEAPQFEESAIVIDLMSRIKKASMAMDDGKFDEALSHFPAYPDAHIAAYEKNRQAWHQKGFAAIEKEVMLPALAALPNSQKATFFCADICMRYEEFEKAMAYLKTCNEQNPGDPGAIIAIGHCYRSLATKTTDPIEAVKFHEQAREVMRHLQQISVQHAHDAVTWKYADESKIPMPGEK